MGGDRQEETPCVPLIVVRIVAPTGDLNQFISQYCRYFGVEFVFLPTEGLHPPGRLVKFTFALADGTDVVTGEGTVLRMRRDTGNPHKPPGMELRYQILDEESQAIVDRMIELRMSGGAARPEPPPYVEMSFETEKPAPSEKIKKAPQPKMRAAAWYSAGVMTGAAAVLLGGALRSATPAPVIAAAPPPAPTAPAPAPAAPPAPQLGIGGGPLQPLEEEHLELPAPKAIPSPVEPQLPRSTSDLGTLELRSHPDGAWVRVDGHLAGRTPVDASASSGAHEIVFEHPRYAPMTIHARAPGRATAELERPEARVRIESSPSGARVTVDGHTAGVTPLSITTTGFERHRIVVEHNGAVAKKRPYLRNSEETVRFDFSR
jgi:hypothetical protein